MGHSYLIVRGETVGCVQRRTAVKSSVTGALRVLQICTIGDVKCHRSVARVANSNGMCLLCLSSEQVGSDIVRVFTLRPETNSNDFGGFWN